jgi:peptidyl-dipeptidase Dcp
MPSPPSRRRGTRSTPRRAGKLERFILSVGGSEEADALYTAFRGRMPGVEALLKGRGLLDAA